MLLAVLTLGSSWYLVSRLNAESGAAAAARKARNAEILNRAKAALIGYVATQAASSAESDPGRLPCPEAPGNFGNSTNEGIAAGNCALPAVGRLPWRTLGLDKLVDAAGEPLWYVVSPSWALLPPGTPGTLTINSNTVGQLTVDGVANDGIALIIAPGSAFAAPASAALNCAAWSQVRPAAGTPDLRNYLECENATSPADLSFVTSKPPIVNPVTNLVTPVSNDQVIRISVADIMPTIEAAIASRIEREIVPMLNSVYTPTAYGFSGSNPVYPYAVPWVDGVTNPGPSTIPGPPSVAPSNFVGVAGTYKGLLPFNQTQGCTPATNPRCTTTLMAWSSPGAVKVVGSGSGTIRTDVGVPNVCAWESIDVFACGGAYGTQPLSLSVTVTITNVAMGLRAQDLSKVTCTAVDDQGLGIGLQTIPCSVTSVVLQGDGSAIVTVTTSALPDVAASGWNTWALFKISFNRALIGDHALLSTTGPTGWFARNEWFRQIYYVVAPAYATGNTAALRLPPSCTTGNTGDIANDCLRVSNVTPASAQRAILILAGRSINGNSRPSSTLADYLEFGNRTGNYEVQAVTGAVTSAYADTGSANAYFVAAPVTIGRPFQFKAVNANSGDSTLTATGVSTTDLVNSDGTNLSLSQIQAGAVSEVAYDGTRFKLYKRPFNDRVIVIGSN